MWTLSNSDSCRGLGPWTGYPEFWWSRRAGRRQTRLGKVANRVVTHPRRIQLTRGRQLGYNCSHRRWVLGPDSNVSRCSWRFSNFSRSAWPSQSRRFSEHEFLGPQVGSRAWYHGACNRIDGWSLVHEVSSRYTTWLEVCPSFFCVSQKLVGFCGLCLAYSPSLCSDTLRLAKVNKAMRSLNFDLHCRLEYKRLRGNGWYCNAF